VSAEIHNCTFNFAQSSFIRLGSGDIEALTIRSNTFEDCPANGAIYNDATGQTYNLTIEKNWFGDSGGVYTVAWINGVSTQSQNFTGTIQGNRMASNPWAMKLVGDWLVIGNTLETGSAYRTSSYALTEIANFYNMAGANVFEVGHPPQKYTMFGSRTTSGFMTNSEAHTGTLHLGRDGAGYGIAETADVFSQLAVGINGTNGTGIIASSPKALVYADYQTAYNGAGDLRLQAPGVIGTSEVQLIAGTASPLPVIRVSAAKLGFYNVAPVARPAAYTLNAGATTRNLASGATLANVEQTLRQVITDLQANGLLQ
jgi:hypothetical protein